MTWNLPAEISKTERKESIVLVQNVTLFDNKTKLIFVFFSAGKQVINLSNYTSNTYQCGGFLSHYMHNFIFYQTTVSKMKNKLPENVSDEMMDSNVRLTRRHDGHLSSHNTLHSQVGQGSSHQTTSEGQILQRHKQSSVS